MSTHQEILAITSLVMRINELKGDRSFHCTVSPIGVTVTGFDCNDKMESQVMLHDWQEAYLPLLRKLRHDLEQIGQEALIQRQGRAA